MGLGMVTEGLLDLGDCRRGNILGVTAVKLRFEVLTGGVTGKLHSCSGFTAPFFVSCREAYSALFNSLSSRHDRPALMSKFFGDMFLLSR